MRTGATVSSPLCMQGLTEARRGINGLTDDQRPELGVLVQGLLDQRSLAGDAQGGKQATLLELKVRFELIGKAGLECGPSDAALGVRDRRQLTRPLREHQAGLMIVRQTHQVEIALHRHRPSEKRRPGRHIARQGEDNDAPRSANHG